MTVDDTWPIALRPQGGPARPTKSQKEAPETLADSLGSNASWPLSDKRSGQSCPCHISVMSSQTLCPDTRSPVKNPASKVERRAAKKAVGSDV